MSITSEQNNKESIDLIAAQRQFYSQAKKLRNARIIGSLILAILVAPITVILLPKTIEIVGFVSAIWVVVMFLLSHFENQLIKSAATIQEQFDTTLFVIGWNKFLVENKVRPEIVSNAARKFEGERSDLENWYGNLKDIAHEISVLLCQRSNLIWDWRLRRIFAWTIIICLLILVGVDTAIGYYTKISTEEFILGLFLPSISAIIIGVNETKNHFEIASGKERLEGKLANLLDLAIDQEHKIDHQDLRQIQDKIFELRKKATLIPDWWYNMFKGEFENDMQNSLDGYKERTKTTLLNKA